jgi:tripartite-type tricarboxylate transporter receptor subunit TctC
MTTRREFLRTVAATPWVAALSDTVLANDWPQRPVKVLVPFAPGGNTDGIARLVAQRLAESLGQAFIVENHAGAGGIVAAELTARAAPDGYTLMMAALSQIAILPVLKKTDYNPISDFAPIVNVASNPFCLMTSPRFEPKTLQEFVDYVKQRPGQLSYASGGVGSVGHLTMVLFCQLAGLNMVHVPYQGGGPAISGLLAEEVLVYFGNLSEALPHAGTTLRLLATSGAQRSKKLPDIPTVAECGYPGFHSETWNGLIAPAKAPSYVIDLIYRETQKAIQDQVVLQRFDSYGVDALGSSPAEFQQTITQDILQWKTAIAKANVTL